MHKKQTKPYLIAAAVCAAVFLAFVLIAAAWISQEPSSIPEKSGALGNPTFIDMPPVQSGLNSSMPFEVFSAFDEFLKQENNFVPSLLQAYGVKHILVRNSSYIDYFSGYAENISLLDNNYVIIEINETKASRDSNASVMTLGRGWFQTEQDAGVKFKWMQNESYLYYFTSHPGLRVIEITARSVSSSTPLAVISGNKTSEINLTDKYHTYYILADMQNGRNTIQLTAPCSIIENRCISLDFLSIQIIEPESVSDVGIVDYSGFYDLDTDNSSWMGTSANISIFTQTREIVILNFSAISYAKDRGLSVNLNNATLKQSEVPLFWKNFTIVAAVPEGKNVIGMVSDGCDSPSVIEKSPDTRCLGIKIKNVSLHALK